MRGPRTAMKSGPHSPQLEKALTQKRRPNTAKNKNNKLKIKKKGVTIDILFNVIISDFDFLICAFFLHQICASFVIKKNKP